MNQQGNDPTVARTGDSASQSLAQSQGEVTGLLRRWATGDSSALDQLTPLIYGELRKRAHFALRKEAHDLPLDTTGLVQETFLRLLKTDIAWQDRNHFFALSARLIRRVLVDFSRERKSQKRGYAIPHLALPDHELKSPDRRYNTLCG
jgi:RNA polymerase sigma factor (TIGR02999 family)